MNKALTKYKKHLSEQLRSASKFKSGLKMPLTWQPFYSVTFDLDAGLRRTSVTWCWHINPEEINRLFSAAFIEDFENEL